MATISGIFPNFPKKPKMNGNINFRKFEPAFVVNDNFYTALRDFDLTAEILIEYNAYPFGGFVRDIYHNDTPKDLDLIVPSPLDIAEIVKLLLDEGWEEVDIYQTAREYDQKLTCRLSKNGRQIDFVNSPCVIPPTSFDFYANAFAIDLAERKAFYWVRDFNISIDVIALSGTYNKSLFFRPKIQKYAFPILEQKLIVAYNKLRFVHAKKIVRLLSQGWDLHFENFLKFSPIRHLLPLEGTYCEYVTEFQKISSEKKIQLLSPYLTSDNSFVRDTIRFVIAQMENCPGSVFIDALKLIYKAKEKDLKPFKGIRYDEDSSSDEWGG